MLIELNLLKTKQNKIINRLKYYQTFMLKKHYFWKHYRKVA